MVTTNFDPHPILGTRHSPRPGQPIVTGDKLKTDDMLDTVAGVVAITGFRPFPGLEDHMETARLAVYEVDGSTRMVPVLSLDKFVLDGGVYRVV